MQLVIRNRAIGAADLGQIRELIQREGHQGRTHLSRVLCQQWDWRQANGAYREIACRDLLRRLETRGLVQLPPPLAAARRPGYQNKVSALPLDRSPVARNLALLRAELSLALVCGTAAEQLFNGLLHTHHYLGFQPPTGAALKYLLSWQDRPLACARFGPAAWMVASRDRYIGWNDEQRQARRQQVVNNDRFLILPWVRVPHLASYTLARICGRLAADWQAKYSQAIVLAETFVEDARFAGTCYAASHWRYVGPTQGRGRNDKKGEAPVPIKQVWLYALVRDFQRRLCA